MTIEANSRLLTEFSRLFSRLKDHVGKHCECEVDDLLRDRKCAVIDVLHSASEWLIEGDRDPANIAYSVRSRLSVQSCAPKIGETDIGSEAERVLRIILQRKRDREGSLAKRRGETHG